MTILANLSAWIWLLSTPRRRERLLIGWLHAVVWRTLPDWIVHATDTVCPRHGVENSVWFVGPTPWRGERLWIGSFHATARTLHAAYWIGRYDQKRLPYARRVVIETLSGSMLAMFYHRTHRGACVRACVCVVIRRTIQGCYIWEWRRHCTLQCPWSNRSLSQLHRLRVVGRSPVRLQVPARFWFSDQLSAISSMARDGRRKTQGNARQLHTASD